MTFALVHGAWHGAWAWDALIPEFEARSHRVVAPDLPCEDVNAGAAEYAQVVIDALDGSTSGATITSAGPRWSLSTFGRRARKWWCRAVD